MRKNADGSTGVDLNRNYDFRFGGEGASDSPGSDTYHGPSAFSEPESRAVRDFVNALPNLKMMVSYHTFSELILYPWGGVDEPIPDTRALTAFKAMAAKMAQWTGYRPQQSSDLYVATGDTCDLLHLRAAAQVPMGRRVLPGRRRRPVHLPEEHRAGPLHDRAGRRPLPGRRRQQLAEKKP
ncbi:MAG: cpt [Elusimicrobia bacterium]|nr:MAG: cpt [Elusimicrobiota bacterium]